MARVSIPLPEHFPFSMEFRVTINLINRGDHLGNDALVSCLNEARLQYLQAVLGTGSVNMGFSMINADLAVIYKSEAFYGEVLNIEVAATEFSRHGCDLVYRVTEKQTGRLVALAKTAMLLFDLESRQLKTVPDDFQSRFVSPKSVAGSKK